MRTGAARVRRVGRATGVLLTVFAAHVAAHAFAAADLPALVQSGDRSAALRLMADGVDVNARSPDGTTALHWAAHRSDAEFVRALIEHGAEPSVTNDYGVTPISAAAVEGDYDTVRALLDAGADVESANSEGQTVLMAVARTGHVNTARLLLERGADVNAVEKWGGQSALMWAAAQRQPDMIRLLLEYGADVDARGRAHDWQRRVVEEPRNKILHTGGFTPLLYAAREGCVSCVDALVDGGADINLSDPHGLTPLVLALLNRRFDTAAKLMEHGADVNRWDWWGRSPLFLAIDLHHVPNSSRGDLPLSDKATGLDIARMLLARGANVNMRLRQQPPLRGAPNDRGSLDGSVDVFVITVGATALHSAAKWGDEEAVRLLLDHGADPNLRNVFGVTPMLAAAGVGHRYAILRETPIRGLHKTGQDAVATMQRLLQAGASLDDVGANRQDGMTAAHGAAQEGWSEVIEFLHQHGADIEARNGSGATPRDLALRAEHQATVELIDRLLGHEASRAE